MVRRNNGGKAKIALQSLYSKRITGVVKILGWSRRSFLLSLVVKEIPQPLRVPVTRRLKTMCRKKARPSPGPRPPAEQRNPNGNVAVLFAP